MKKLVTISCLSLLSLLAVAATVSYGNLWVSTKDINIQNQTNSVALTITKGGNLSSNFIECYIGSTLVYAVPTNGLPTNGTVSLPLSVANGGTGAQTVTNAQLALGIQSGTNYISNDFSVTNTFSTAYLVRPTVQVSSSATNGLPAVVQTTTTFVVLRANITNQTFHWTAIGKY